MVPHCDGSASLWRLLQSGRRHKCHVGVAWAAAHFRGCSKLMGCPLPPPACPPWQELGRLLQEERLAGATLLIMANKQDVPGALGADAIREASGCGCRNRVRGLLRFSATSTCIKRPMQAACVGVILSPTAPSSPHSHPARPTGAAAGRAGGAAVEHRGV